MHVWRGLSCMYGGGLSYMCGGESIMHVRVSVHSAPIHRCSMRVQDGNRTRKSSVAPMPDKTLKDANA